MIESAKKVLIVAAHPDDEVLGVGGTVPRLVEAGAKVSVLIVTDGSSSQYEGDEAVAVRKRAQLKAANQILGTTELIEWEFPDMRLDTVPHAELTKAFGELIFSDGFDTVFVHHDGDINRDHKEIHQAVLVATRPVPDQPVRRVYSYHVNSSTEWGGRTPRDIFIPNVFVNIDGTVQQKLDAMAAYTDELREYPHPRSLAALRERASVYGSEVGMMFAEPFRLILERVY